MKKLINRIKETRFYLEWFCGYKFKTVRSMSLSNIENVWQKDLMLNGWDVHIGIEVSQLSGFYAVFCRMPLTAEFNFAAKEMGYNCHSWDEFYLMGLRGEVDWTRVPEHISFSEDFRETFNLD